MNQNCRLLRKKESAKSNKVIIIGNGAIERGSDPLEKTFEDLLPASEDSNHADWYRKNLKDKSLFLSLLSFKFRISRLELFRKIEKNGGYSKWDKIFPQPIRTFLELRKKIASNFIDFKEQNKISLRGSLNNGYFNKNDLFITTNWDSLIWDDEEVSNIIQLHGITNFPESMIMPTELITDDLMYDFLKICDKDLLDSITKGAYSMSESDYRFMECYRFNFLTELTQAHDLCIEWISRANEIVIWGSSLSTYDAELLAQISTHTNVDKIDKITIVNPCDTALNKAISIIGVSPNKVTKISNLE
ncbi:MAG: hypothetical protein HQK52_08005 [Oligoflexia bacterium]|nr:hypothetical protein [Oligoflexia bacterium]